MPRIYDSQSNPIDFCKRCYPRTEADARAEYGNAGDGPDGRGNCFDYEADHPDYSDFGMEYTCEVCGKPLTARDD